MRRQWRNVRRALYDESAHGDASRGRKSSARARMWKYSPLSDVADDGEGDGFEEGDSDGVGDGEGSDVDGIADRNNVGSTKVVSRLSVSFVPSDTLLGGAGEGGSMTVSGVGLWNEVTIVPAEVGSSSPSGVPGLDVGGDLTARDDDEDDVRV